ncbi:serine--tRNA ligase [Candidatus Micrarchaeota archaeon]|nr:serine--tRNA ligase [Candidatus Micrarchaeota archaeon]MBU1165668.1 serine--tRNA ligase [Candidatus Micrarchaeota archaeon]MBU1887472.1 serine--tRNA ligase [Candidatus Micrarchaeota archaeon]
MIDIHIIRDTPEIVGDSLKNRNAHGDFHPTLLKVIELDMQWRAIKKEEDELRSERNKLAEQINVKKKAGGDATSEIRRSGEISTRIKDISVETETLSEQVKTELLMIPNIPDQTVPIGENETANPEIRKCGEPRKKQDDIISHYDFAQKTDRIDFERGVKLACHRFTVMRGDIAKLERALVNFMLSVQTSRGYLEIAPPYLVNTKTMTGTGQLPKFKEDLYKCEGEDLWLIPTAEVPLTNLFADEMLNEKDLPMKFVAFTPCFRREAGAYGKDIRGLIRQHQFNKVELVKFAHPKTSFHELESLTKDAEQILKILELPYRVIELCTGDIGFSAAKTYDIEVWIPSQNTYREISSCSNCTDFQARRANIRYMDTEKGKPEFAHTLNGSGLAVGRTLIAILENFQEDKKTIVIPKVLQDFMGQETIEL